MPVQSVEILKTLKFHKRIWPEGSVLMPPFPPEIVYEIRNNTGTIRVNGIVEDDPDLSPRRVDYHFEPEFKGPKKVSSSTTFRTDLPEEAVQEVKLIKRKKK